MSSVYITEDSGASYLIPVQKDKSYRLIAARVGMWPVAVRTAG